MLLFGRSLFGGALAAGFVTLAGVASCTAQAAGEAQVLYNAAGVADGSASVAAGALRTAVAIGDSAQAVASAHAAPLAEFLLSGSAQASAQASGSSLAWYMASGVMRACANASVAAAIRIRGFSGVASAGAQASGYMDMRYTGQVGAPAQVHAYAYGYGVRRVEGEGECTALAQGLASPQMAANLAGEAQAGATLGVSTVEFQLFVVPAQAGAHASGWAERIRIAAGAPATADASATGANQINDLSRAPRARTLSVAAPLRHMLVSREDRRIAVEV